MLYALAYIILLVSLIFSIVIVYNLGNDKTSLVRKRLMRIKGQSEDSKSIVHHKKATKGFLNKYLIHFSESFRKIGIEITDREIILINAITYLTCFLIFFLLMKNISLAFILGIIGLLLPYLTVNSLAKQRLSNFEKLFGDALYLIANTLHSGFSLRQALQIIAQEMPSPVSDEFDLLNQELNWGLSIEEAMQNFAKRLDNEHVNLFVTAIMIQSEVGGSLAILLSKIAETIRSKQELKGEIKVMTSQGKASGIIVGSLPVLITAVIMLINPTFMLPMFTTPIGLFLIFIALLLEICGAVIIKAMTGGEL